MALSGLHVAHNLVHSPNSCGLQGRLLWSETLASAGTTVNAAQPNRPTEGGFGPSFPAFEVSASVDAWVAFGPSPDASQAAGAGNTARYLVRAGTDRQWFAQAGDRVAWAPV